MLRLAPLRCCCLALALVVAPTGAALAQTTGGGASPPIRSETIVDEQALRAIMERIDAVEGKLSSSALLDLVARVEQLMQQLQQQRETIELQGHTIEGLQARQQDLYAELDRLARRIGEQATRPPATTPPSTNQPAADNGTTAAPTSPGTTPPAGGATPPTAPTAAPPPDLVADQSRYQLAFDLLSDGSFERAAAAFREYLDVFPNGRHRANAQFWLAECLYELQEFGDSMSEFRQLVDVYPDSVKVPGAHLKIGFILQQLDRDEEAKTVLSDLVDQYPASSEANIARNRLEQLE